MDDVPFLESGRSANIFHRLNGSRQARICVNPNATIYESVFDRREKDRRCTAASNYRRQGPVFEFLLPLTCCHDEVSVTGQHILCGHKQDWTFTPFIFKLADGFTLNQRAQSVD